LSAVILRECQSGGKVVRGPLFTRARVQVLYLLLTAALLASPVAQAAKCTLKRFPDIPVIMRGPIPTVRAQLNGKDALFIADSGAFFDFIAPAAVAEFQLKPDYSVRDFYVAGVGGMERGGLAYAKTFTILGTTFSNVPFVVAGSGYSGGAVGLIGQNVFRIADVEYDLANGVIRLAKPQDCKDTALAYWATQTPYSVINIQFPTPTQPHTRSDAYLNGTRIRVMFDTGSPASVLTLEAARRAGVTPQSPGVLPGGPVWGIGPKISNSYIATFASFKIGEEEIRNARLRFGDLAVDTDMLIGADFFLSHRIYVASSQRRLYFTYNGGPVFDLTTRREPPPAAEGGDAPAQDAPQPGGGPGAGGTRGGEGSSDSEGAPEPGPASPTIAAPPRARAGEPSGASQPAVPDPWLNEPVDAAGYARRGSASAARHDYAAALADLTRACELSPNEASYYYERGVVHWNNNQADQALADFDHAIKLSPDNATALMARASLRARRHEAADAIEPDLVAADRGIAKESDAHLRIGFLYQYIDDPAAALPQFSKWIDTHPRADVRMASALNARCRARALLGQQLDRALADCNSALKQRPDTAEYLDSRGLVYLRLGNVDKAIADYDAALRQRPNDVWSLYGRGVARLRKGLTSEGQADISAATALQPNIAERAARFGVQP
jgi:tetratricopeptide (TPR) repeat protein